MRASSSQPQTNCTSTAGRLQYVLMIITAGRFAAVIARVKPATRGGVAGRLRKRSFAHAPFFLRTRWDVQKPGEVRPP